MKRWVPHYLQKRIETLSILPHLDDHQALGNKSYISEWQITQKVSETLERMSPMVKHLVAIAEKLISPIFQSLVSLNGK